MEGLISLITRLCVLSCLSALCQLLLGPGKFRGHVRLVCGLLLLHMMMTQITLLLRGAPPAVTDAAFVTNVLTGGAP